MSRSVTGRGATLARAGGQGYASSSILERRQRILATVRSLIADEGVAAVNMDEVSRRADVAKRTLYNAFQNKERLIAAAIEQYFDDHELELTYATPPATAERIAEHLALMTAHSLSTRNYTRALVNIYYAADLDADVRRTICEMVAQTHRPWIQRLDAERQLQPWIDRDVLVDDLVRYRYGVANDWVGGRIADADLAGVVIRGVLTFVSGALRPRARRETEDVLKQLDATVAVDRSP